MVKKITNDEINTNLKKVWVDGDTLVKEVGEAEASNYLYGTGFQARLTNFIRERDKKLAEEAKNKKTKPKAKKPVASEPGIE